MITIESFIAVISLCMTCFSLGYSIGRNSKAQKQPPQPANLAVISTNIMWTNRLSAVPL